MVASTGSDYHVHLDAGLHGIVNIPPKKHHHLWALVCKGHNQNLPVGIVDVPEFMEVAPDLVADFLDC
ncbi:hypothetical protein PC129_g12347 [Phytophthora cactorum]|uniref:Uncharacterized protein n=1 Tax=Phytophthora cactorum TaxID=29920 RepID=A0A8T1BS71_9STRA|nr:hypothetical protein Pcac1_g16958 [Phytophthora cactorum]KAG2811490.1 hypothetical protein PC111_g15212 [Phytophthora cactorum]KAG2816173.1 hypothetical protein PC112_g13578 [Phytophthora cactorum]KAG2842929.1 hypothetical protein PC113_g18692 [Phytophthora cactorum]KAG2884591.1 hypothetical protein PC114_g20001 [Phytophthora cactorum]